MLAFYLWQVLNSAIIKASKLSMAVAIYRGYCRWGRQQLAQEFEDGDWAIAPSRASDLAPELQGEDLWRDVLRRSTGAPG